jgi:hypothetical protein
MSWREEEDAMAMVQCIGEDETKFLEYRETGRRAIR